jgi:predicted transcriptional regulator
MLNDVEKTILKKLSETHLATKHELKKMLSSNHKNLDVDTVTKNLIEKNLLRAINPVGSTCYIITQKGTRTLREIGN